MVDQAEIGTKRLLLIDSIQLRVRPISLDQGEIKRLFLEEKLTAVQIARKFDVAKSVILGLLHRQGVRIGKVGRSTNPQNYRNPSPPYGYRVKDGKLVLNKSELKICRLIVDLKCRREKSLAEIATHLEMRGFKNRNGRTVWNSNTIQKIYKRWEGKI